MCVTVFYLLVCKLTVNVPDTRGDQESELNFLEME